MNTPYEAPRVKADHQNLSAKVEYLYTNLCEDVPLLPSVSSFRFTFILGALHALSA